jgi:cell division protein FtsN
MRLLLVLCVTLIVGVSHAQSVKKKKRPASDSPRKSENTLEPYYPQNNYQPSKKSSKRKDEGPSYDSEKEYYARLEQLEKTRRKNEKLMEKPQYSDPTYFGHKHPPKKRARGKMKFCKECGIRH